ncbi:MAG: trypsin-like serine protease [Bdellovibrionaceae bacterium]|nr:trypsin-like serine protease [Pseudobdellovibrionaceae bacterium]
MKPVLQLTVLACVFVSIVSCSKKNARPDSFVQATDSSSIINGEIVLADNELGHSTVGLLVQIKNTWYQYCTGTIIAKNMILTAAHCVAHTDPERSNVVINFSLNTVDNAVQGDPVQKHIEDVRATFDTIDVVGITAHPDYKGGVDYDMAILRLKIDIPSTRKIAEFLPQNYIDAVGNKLTLDGEIKDVTLLGFGLIDENTGESSSVLRKTIVPARFEGAVVVTDQTHGTGACNGDSGGPAFVKIDDKNYLVGVTHGPYLDYKTCHEYGVYLNPNLYLDFIDKTMKKLDAMVIQGGQNFPAVFL